MNSGIWIALGVIVFLLILFILFDNRKKIFKKREKKVKEEVEIKESKDTGKKEETKKVKRIDNPKISLAKKVKVEEQQKAQAEELNLDGFDDEPITYQRTPSMGFAPRKKPIPMQFDRSRVQRELIARKSKKRSIKEQIKDLSPEMKAILFTNALGKRDDK